MSQAPSHAAAAVSPWILSPVRDLALFVATPVLILPLTLALLYVVDSPDIRLFVLAFGAMGHNLPGMLRAYGDRALFQRFKTRFILSPIILAVVCYAFAERQSMGLVLIAYLWSVWHALMQVYGFMRIYDGKIGAFQWVNARLDLAMCIAWFVGAVVFSDPRMYFMQSLCADFGIAAMPAAGLYALRVTMGVVLGIVTVLYLWNQLSRWRAGQQFNNPKNLLVLTSIGFWWYANVEITDILLGLVMFEVFHDVQYLSIVWLFNRRRVDTDPSVGGFTRFVFRRSWGMLGVYVALVFAYGGVLPASQYLASSETGAILATTIVTTSAMLHYYYDGFIWKVRESSTRKSLGLAGEAGTSDLRVSTHGAKWLLLLVPAAVMWFAEEKAPDSLPRAQALVESTPRAADAHVKLGVELSKAGRHEESVAAIGRAVALEPENQKLRTAMALARFEAGKYLIRNNQIREAEKVLKEAQAEMPDLAATCNKRGRVLWQEKHLTEANVHLRVALLLEPEMARAHVNIALVYRDSGLRDLALQHAKRAAKLSPGDEQARQLVTELER